MEKKDEEYIVYLYKIASTIELILFPIYYQYSSSINMVNVVHKIIPNIMFIHEEDLKKNYEHIIKIIHLIGEEFTKKINHIRQQSLVRVEENISDSSSDDEDSNFRIMNIRTYNTHDVNTLSTFFSQKKNINIIKRFIYK